MVLKKKNDSYSKEIHYKIGLAILSIVAFAFLLGYFYQANKYYALQVQVNQFLNTLNITPLTTAQELVKAKLSQLLNTSTDNVEIVNAQYVEGLYAYNITYNNTYYLIYSTIDTSYLLLPYQDAINGLMLKVYPLKQ